MLDVFRENLRSLKWVLLLVVASFIVALFAVWGGGATGGSGRQSWAAEVNGRTITVLDLQNRARQLDNLYRQAYGREQYEQMRQSIDIFGLALEQLINEELLLSEAERMGIRVTDRELQERIQRHPDLQENGKFIGRDRYLQLVRAGAFDVRGFEEGIRRDLQIEKVRGLLEDGIQVSETEIRAEYRRLNERLSVDFIMVPPAAFSDRVEVTDADIEEIYQLRQEAFRKPERRQGAYIELETLEVGRDLYPTDADVFNYYQQHQATKYTHRDQRRASHILFRVPQEADADTVAAIEQKARQVLERVGAGEDFAELAREFGEDGTAKAGGDLGYFGKGAMVPEFEQAVWNLEVGEVSDLVRTPFGFHIVKLMDTQDSRVDSFEEVRDKIYNQVRYQMSMDETGRQMREIKARMGDIENFRTVAEELGLTVKDTGLVTADGSIEGVPNSFLIVKQLFQLTPGEISEPFGMPKGQVLLVLERTVPGEIPDLADIRDRVEQDAREEKAFEWLAGRVEAMKGAGSMSSLAELAADLDFELQQATDLSHGSLLQSLPQTLPVVERAFELNEGEWLGPERIGGTDLLLLQVTGKTGSPEGLETQHDSLYRNLIAQKRDRHFRSIMRKLHDGGRVVRNLALLAQAQRS